MNDTANPGPAGDEGSGRDNSRADRAARFASAAYSFLPQAASKRKERRQWTSPGPDALGARSAAFARAAVDPVAVPDVVELNPAALVPVPEAVAATEAGSGLEPFLAPAAPEAAESDAEVAIPEPVADVPAEPDPEPQASEDVGFGVDVGEAAEVVFLRPEHGVQPAVEFGPPDATRDELGPDGGAAHIRMLRAAWLASSQDAREGSAVDAQRAMSLPRETAEHVDPRVGRHERVDPDVIEVGIVMSFLEAAMRRLRATEPASALRESVVSEIWQELSAASDEHRRALGLVVEEEAATGSGWSRRKRRAAGRTA